MNALWHRRAVRHLILGLLPLLVVGAAVIAVLADRLAETAGPLRDATARATATVQRTGIGDDGRDVELAWTDDTGAARLSTVRAARASDVPVGARIQLRYRPGDPGRVFVGGDETSSRVADLSFGIGLAGLLMLAIAVATAVHITRRRAAERRPAVTLPVSYGRSRLGLTRRSWLVIEEAGRSWWVSVHWEPALTGLAPGTPARVHGRPSRDRVLAVEVDGTTIWSAGRRRSTPPRGEIERDAADEGPEERPANPALGRQFRADAGLLAAAPILGLLWAYVDDGGRGSWVLATALSAAALIWVPAVIGSDPT